MKISRARNLSAISCGLVVAACSLAACTTDTEDADGIAPPVAGVGPTVQANGGIINGEIIIGFKPGATAADKVRARGKANAAHGEALAASGGGDLELATLPPGLALHAAAAALKDDPAVDFAEPNYRVEHKGFPVGAVASDPRFGDQLWAVKNTSQLINPDDTSTPTRAVTGGADVDMDLSNAWAQMAIDGKVRPKVYVGIIDEGIDYSHPDLAGVIGNPNEQGPDPACTAAVCPDRCTDGKDNDGNGKIDDCYGWDFVNNDRTIYDGTARKPADAHGTHVSGTIGALANNGGVTGVTSNVGIISAKFLGTTGGTTAASINAVAYLTGLKAKGVNIVASNNSWGGGGFSTGLYDAIKAAGTAGILFVAAAGNETTDTDATPSYPCSYGRDQKSADTFSKGKIIPGKFYPALTNVICVAAHDQDGKMGPASAAYFSNWGKNTVDVAAPGTNILSTTPDNTYSYYRGTSMATPHVTGLVALLASDGVPVSDIKARITSTTVVNPAEFVTGRDTRTNGRVNAFRALNSTNTVDPAN